MRASECLTQQAGLLLDCVAALPPLFDDVACVPPPPLHKISSKQPACAAHTAHVAVVADASGSVVGYAFMTQRGLPAARNTSCCVHS